MHTHLHKFEWLILYIFCIGLILFNISAYYSGRHSGLLTIRETQFDDTQETIVIIVKGAVHLPGIYRVPKQTKRKDFIKKIKPLKCADRLSQCKNKILKDGELIIISSKKNPPAALKKRKKKN